jgi:peptidyl-prolyl cis-trans isomerase SurA
MMRSVAFILLCFSFILPANAQSKKSKPLPVFSVNKKTVTADEFVYLYKKNHQNKPEEFTSEKIQEYLDLFINFKLKVEEARRRGLDTTAAFRKEFESYKDELRKPYLPDNRLTDSLARLTYNRMKEEVKASHILINVKPDASPKDTLAAYTKVMDLRKRIQAGEDFVKLATEYSEDPSAKSNQGSLGYFSAMQMVYAFENAAYNTKRGEVSMPVRTRFGYHLIKVFDRRESRGQVEVSHIMIATAGEKDEKKAKDEIFDVYDQLRAGVSWEEMVKQYSEDPGTKDAGGRLRPFGVGEMASVPVFEQAAFSLQKTGDISDPFLTQFGWHIIRLENKIPLAPYDEMAASLKSRVNRDERTQISKQALQAKLRKEFSFKEFTPIKEKIMQLADTSLRKGKWKATPLPGREILFSMQGRSISANEFLTYAQKNQRQNALTPDKYFEQLYNNFVDLNITQLLEETIIKKNPDFQMLLNEYYEGIMLFDIMEREVWNKAAEDSVGQEKYFNQNKSKYMAGQRAKAVIYSAASKTTLDDLAKKISSGDTTALAEYVAQGKIKHEQGLFEKEDKSILAKVDWQKGLHPTENNTLNYLVWIKDILPPGQKTFQEARPAVITDYQGFLEKSWIESLKKKYPVKLNKKGKAYVFAQLQTK